MDIRFLIVIVADLLQIWITKLMPNEIKYVIFATDLLNGTQNEGLCESLRDLVLFTVCVTSAQQLQ